MARAGIADPTEETWQRVETFDAAGYFITWNGKYGPWKFQSYGEENRWSEEEMAAVDALMRRVCDIDRAHWRFHRFRGEQYSSRFSADAPSWKFPGLLNMTLEGFLFGLEANWLGMRLERWDYALDANGERNGDRTAKHCQWCPLPVRSLERSEKHQGGGRRDLWAHILAEHPVELQALRDEREKELEDLRDYYRRKDSRYDERRDGPRVPRTYIL